MSVWYVVAVAGACSYLFRVSMLVLAARTGVPAGVERAARFAVPVAFAALATSALASDVAKTGADALPAIAAVGAGAIAAHRLGSSQMALLVGMPTLWILTALT